MSKRSAIWNATNFFCVLYPLLILPFKVLQFAMVTYQFQQEHAMQYLVLLILGKNRKKL